MREILEPILSRLRIAAIKNTALKVPNCRLLDVGCGQDAILLRAMSPHIKAGVGLDKNVSATIAGNIQIMSLEFSGRLPFNDNDFDVCTLLAVLEHIDDDSSMLKEISRVLRPGGQLILTVPSWHAKPVLEFLAFRLGIVSREQIADHKRYYNKADLCELIARINDLEIVSHRYFQLGMNNRLVCRRT